MNKSLLTNLIAAAVCGGTYACPEFTGKQALFLSGLFALSGALTNWLAVHMLFEKIPGFYGSGIITLRFEEFKAGIRSLIMENFFTEENFAKVSKEALPHEIDPDLVMGKIDLDKMFDGFISVVKASPFGGMLDMFGGTEALEPLRDPFKKEFEKRISGILQNIDISSVLQRETDFKTFKSKIGDMVDTRLDELTPKHVKSIIEDMIRQHLGWLVVWGGVFGAFIGFLSTLLL
ncbi:hypothetical protein SCALIN_C29_0009 [Candidatus Scalindua japonica]|uniref:DUF445 domain-containing protein n=1 Tax=Candidatus Scalindua japonica TaxID=1284222 RepID=A0A286U264_9BACT|nr:hypothetical protein SCALIN_C29_0009 [Candidatus Scalindua japonica]